MGTKGGGRRYRIETSTAVRLAVMKEESLPIQPITLYSCHKHVEPANLQSMQHGGSSRPDYSSYQQKVIYYLNTLVEQVQAAHRMLGLDQVFKFYSCNEEILLKHGHFYYPVKIEDFPFEIKRRSENRRWLTAYKLLADPYLYSEGIVVLQSGDLVESAWLYDPRIKKVVDPTYISSGVLYFGIIFNTDFVHQRAREIGVAGILPNDLSVKQPIVMHGFPPESLYHNIK